MNPPPELFSNNPHNSILNSVDTAGNSILNSAMTYATDRDLFPKCFACGKAFKGGVMHLVDTRDDQKVYVGSDCLKRIQAAGDEGYQGPKMPKGGVRLYVLHTLEGCQKPQ